MTAETRIFDAGRVCLERGINLVEASAGTGKTYAIAMLALRAVVELGVPIEAILIVTFTKAATEELRARIRARLVEARDLLSKKKVDADPTLAGWEAGLANRELALARLQLALYDIDRVGIFTIHSFCRKMLQEQALESGQLFDMELLADIEDIRIQVADDFWRSHLYGLSPRACSVVTTVFSTPESLLASIKGAESVAAIEPSPTEIDEALKTFNSAFSKMAAWWSEHGAALGTILSAAVEEEKVKKGFRDEYPAWWQACDTFFREKSHTLPENLLYLTREGLVSQLNGQKLRGDKKKEAFLAGVVLPEAEIAGLEAAAQGLLLTVRGRLASDLMMEVERRLTQIGAMSFDDLVLRLSKALDWGDNLQELVGGRYKVALIDEFQDTDAAQWHIFRCLFGAGNHYFYLIGDPKQAIYKFRGADIHSYFQAKKAADHHLSLDKNHRSHPELVHEVNRLFTSRRNPFSFPEEIMAYSPVSPARKAEDGFLEIGGQKAEAMLYCQLPETDKGAWSSGKAALAIRNFIVSEVIGLLDARNPMHLVGDKNGPRPVKPHDIAILVRSNSQAQDYLQAFSQAGIPAVINSRLSVFQTEACHEMFLLLEAIVNPGDINRLKTAMTITWFGLTGDELLLIWQDEARFDQWHRRFQLYYRMWQEQGFLAMMTRLMDDEAVLVALAAGRTAQRHIANIHHLLELVQTAESTDNFGIGQTLQWLKMRMKAEQAEEDVELRLESDEEAIRIVTMHSAKGLEYPVVFCPYLWYGSTGLQSQRWSVSCHDSDERLILDLGSDRFDERKKKAVEEAFAEDLRVAYVALTRARLRCYVFWADVKGSGKTADSFSSALAYLLFPDGRVEFEAQKKVLQTRATHPFVGYRTVAEAKAETVAVFERGEKERQLNPLSPSGRSLLTGWQMTSYSALAQLSDGDEKDHVISVHTPSAGDAILCPGLPAGPGFGNVIHGVLEQVPFADLAQGTEIGQVVSRLCGRYGVTVDPELLQRLLCAVVTTPLTPEATFSLAGLDAGCCVAEMPFYFHPDRIDTDAINSLLSFDPTVVPLSHKVMQGYVTGFIDLFFQYQGRFFIVDYKTNYLGDLADNYSKDNLVRAMAGHNYGLQYWIYTLVLDRYLKNALPGYSYERHFGGIFYLFVRGMAPSVPGSGIYFALPDGKTLDKLAACVGDGS